ncbi:hypothetical protein [Christensenella timonensis]|uniref:hypothetical protein n=1 Tax=Christensenella timonensis TaxID=1816678 RepID=UPI0011C702A5|nr:hypothetical protein [Christensenella timonensis]
MEKWKKRVCAFGMVAAMLVFCCSCGMLRDFGKDLLARQAERVPQSAQHAGPSLPPAQAEETDDRDSMPEPEGDTAEFERLVDTESLLSGGRVVTLEEVQADVSYFAQEDGTYLKETPFMGKDGGVMLHFGASGKNDYVDYFYEGQLKGLTPLLVAKEFTVLMDAAQQKYGKANLHVWSVSPTGFYEDMSLVGEFTDEDVTDAVTHGRMAAFQYAWNTIGGNLVYATLFLDGDGSYAVDFIYDNTQSGSAYAYEV